MESVLGTIFREPDLGLRNLVLAEYLTRVPLREMARGFELCRRLEGTQTPDELVALFIGVWAERDPAACWRWVKKLFHLAAIEDVLAYDSWSNPRIPVQDLSALRASPSWIDSNALERFPDAISRSKLKKAERSKILKEFGVLWVDAFSRWTRADPTSTIAKRNQPNKEDLGREVMSMLSRPIGPDMQPRNGKYDPESLPQQVAARRLLTANPASAPDIIKRAAKIMQYPRNPEKGENYYRAPSYELLLLWAKCDLPGMVRWVEALDGSTGIETNKADDGEFGTPAVIMAKGLLLCFVDAATRQRWLTNLKITAAEPGALANLWQEWAKWDLAAALQAAARVEDPAFVERIADSGVYGPWFGQPYNQSLYAFHVLSTFDYSALPPEIHQRVFHDCYSLMEQWDTMDVAGAAKFGFGYLLRSNYAPRDRLIKFFSGKNIYPGEDGMIDRTFCALRVWAVVRPTDMKQWITTIDDAEMRRALTWLLAHPWGSGAED